MAFELSSYAKLRPYSYHLTEKDNLRQIATEGVLRSAERILVAGGREDLLREKRTEHVTVVIDGQPILVRDQQPLSPRKMTLVGGLSYGDFIHLVNRRVFFWPGTRVRPIQQGVRHFERYEDERPVVVRVKTSELFDANAHNPPEFAHFNTGAPRCLPPDGKGSVRGARTFLPCGEFERTPGRVIELTFCGEAILPLDACEWQDLGGGWDSFSNL